MRYRPTLINRLWLRDIFGMAMLTAGLAGFWCADWIAPVLFTWWAK